MRADGRGRSQLMAAGLGLRTIARSVAIVAVLLACGCPDGEIGRASENCTKAYDKCTLPNGVLGICDSAEPTADEPTPRLVCRSQH